MIGDLFGRRVKRQLGVHSLRDDADGHRLAQRPGHREAGVAFLLALTGAEEVDVVVRRAFGHDWKLGNNILRLFRRQNFQCRRMGTALEGQAIAVNHLPRRTLFIGRHGGALRGGRNVRVEDGIADVVRQGRQVFLAVIPGEFHRRFCAARGEAERQRRGLRENERAVAVELHRLDFRRQSELQKLVGGVEDVCPPIAERAVTEVKP